MVDLVQALIQVKTPLTLFAFVSLVFLAAFRTQRVPELFFEMAKVKLSKDQFGRLLHRFMVFGFAAFVLACGVAFAGTVLAYKAKPKPVALDDLRRELQESNAAADQRDAALKSYADGLAYIQQHDFNQAIQSLEQSLRPYQHSPLKLRWHISTRGKVTKRTQRNTQPRRSRWRISGETASLSYGLNNC